MYFNFNSILIFLLYLCPLSEKCLLSISQMSSLDPENYIESTSWWAQKEFLPCCFRIFTLSRMPRLEAALEIYQQYFFDICHTHFSTVLSNTTFSWIIYLKSTSYAKEMVIMEAWQFFGFVTLMKPGNVLRQVQAPIEKEMEWYSWILSVLWLFGFSTH